MVMVLLPVSGHLKAANAATYCCVTPLSPLLLGHGDVLVTMLLPGFWNAPGNNADLPHSHPRAGLPPTFCFISSPSSPSPFSFLTLFFLTDKRILNEPKSHRKCSFHGHFFLFVCSCGFVLLNPWQGFPGSWARTEWEDTTAKAHSKTPVGSSGLSLLECECCSQLYEPELQKPSISGTLDAQVKFALSCGQVSSKGLRASPPSHSLSLLVTSCS